MLMWFYKAADTDACCYWYTGGLAWQNPLGDSFWEALDNKEQLQTKGSVIKTDYVILFYNENNLLQFAA